MPDVLFQHVSSDAKDFISKLLVVDQEKRMSAEQALAHPWLRRPTRCVPVPFDIYLRDKHQQCCRYRLDIMRPAAVRFMHAYT